MQSLRSFNGPIVPLLRPLGNSPMTCINDSQTSTLRTRFLRRVLICARELIELLILDVNKEATASGKLPTETSQDFCLLLMPKHM